MAAGGDLNIPTDDPCWKRAREESLIAYDLRAKASPADRLYIEALVERYGNQPNIVRDPQQRGVYYAAAMKSFTSGSVPSILRTPTRRRSTPIA